MRPRLIAGSVALATLVAVTAVGGRALGGGGETADRSPTPVSEHAAAVPAFVRTVSVSRAMPMPSAHARHLSTMLEKGTMPDRPMMADVMTDTDCTPDEQMISHCRNVMRLANGRQIVLRHPHDMTDVPCLAPGERVRLIPAGV